MAQSDFIDVDPFFGDRSDSFDSAVSRFLFRVLRKKHTPESQLVQIAAGDAQIRHNF